MDIFELTEKLCEKSEEEIEYALVSMMLKKKIDFIQINKAYVKYLESISEDRKLKLIDANTCTLALLTNIKTENKSNHADVHWALHNLNESKQFNMSKLNEKFGYDKENDCKYSFYWRETHHKNSNYEKNKTREC